MKPPRKGEESTFYAAYGAFTPLPNVFIDCVMPGLTDTAWRLLCVITRQTLGWKQVGSVEDSDERKTSDWLTHSQLIGRTGRSSEAVSRALGDLVAASLVEVHNEHGKLMPTPQARRRNGGRLYYRLSQNARAAARRFGRQSVEQKAAAGPEYSPTTSFERHRKTGTTKENGDKELPEGRKLSTANDPKPGALWHEAKGPNPNVKRFLRAYRRRVHQMRALRAVLGESPVTWERDSVVVARLLEQFDYGSLRANLEGFLQAQIWRRGAVTLPAFQKWVTQPKLQRKNHKRRDGVRHGRWMQANQVRRRF
jgi:hypothetical protein